MKNKELLPCPFCGGEASMVRGTFTKTIGSVICTKCGISTQVYVTDEDAIKAWNTRTNDLINRQQARNKQLRDTLQKHMDVEKFLAKLTDEQQAEIERLKNDIFCISNERDAWKDTVNTTADEAIKEFAEKLKEKADVWEDADFYFQYITTNDIDKLAKEMVGNNENT